MPTIRFNNSTGSDTTASGSAGAIVANGTSASFSGKVVTLDGSPDLSGFNAADDVLWLKTSSGRQFFDLSAADNTAKTVTTVDDPAGTSSGLTWGIGGKRATISNADSQVLFANLKGGWDVVFEYTGTNYTYEDLWISSGGSASTGYVRIRGTGGAVVWECNKSTNVNNAVQMSTSASWVWFADLTILRTGTGGIVQGCVGGTTNSLSRLRFTNVRILQQQSGSKGSGIYTAANPTTAFIEVIDCQITDATNGIFVNAGGLAPAGGHVIAGCEIFGCSGNAIQLGRASNTVIRDNLLHDNGGHGIALLGSAAGALIEGNTIDNNTGDGLYLDADTVLPVTVRNNNLTRNAEGIDPNFTAGLGVIFNDYNNFGFDTWANVSGPGVTLGPHDLNVDPQYTNAAGGDFSVGTNLKAKGFPDATRTIGANQSATRSYVDIGAAQREEPTGGGGGGGNTYSRARLVNAGG